MIHIAPRVISAGILLLVSASLVLFLTSSGVSHLYGSDTPLHRTIFKRSGGGGITSNIPSGWKYVGCRKDQREARALPVLISSSNSQTQDKCLAACKSRGYKYCGLEKGKECWGGNNLYLRTQSSGTCDKPCKGNPNQKCGGKLSLNLFAKRPIPTITSYALEGCFLEKTTSRILTGPSIQDKKGMTVNRCRDFCRGSTYFGVENGSLCFCGNSVNYKILKPQDQCNVLCTGDSTLLCGGRWRMYLYTKYSVLFPPSSSAPSSSSATSSTSTV